MAAGACAGRSALVPDPCDPHDGRGNRRHSPRAAPSPACARSPRPSLGDGIFAGARFLDAGGRFGVGTDSNVLIGVADELRQLEYCAAPARIARATCSRPAPAVRPGARCSTQRLPAARGRWRADRGSARRARAPISSRSTPRIRRWPARARRRRARRLDLCRGQRRDRLRLGAAATRSSRAAGISCAQAVARTLQRSRAEARRHEHSPATPTGQADALQAHPRRHRASGSCPANGRRAIASRSSTSWSRDTAARA